MIHVAYTQKHGSIGRLLNSRSEQSSKPQLNLSAGIPHSHICRNTDVCHHNKLSTMISSASKKKWGAITKSPSRPLAPELFLLHLVSLLSTCTAQFEDHLSTAAMIFFLTFSSVQSSHSQPSSLYLHTYSHSSPKLIMGQAIPGSSWSSFLLLVCALVKSAYFGHLGS